MRTISTKVRLHADNEVQVTNAYLAQADTGFALVVDVINNTSKTIEAIKLEVMFINAFDKLIFDETVFRHDYPDLKIPPKTLSYLPNWILDERHHTARGVRIRIAEVHFDDATRKYYDGKDEHYQTVPIIPTEKMEKLQNLFGPDFYTYGGRYNPYWRCICGFTNGEDDENCRFCHRSRDFILSAMTERQVNKKLYKMYISRDRDLAQRASETLHTMPIRPLTEIDTERGLLADEKPVPKRRRILVFLAIALGIVFFSFFSFRIYHKIHISRNYKRAQDLIAMGRYEEAESIYATLPPTVDNVDMALKHEELASLKTSEANYKKGLELSRAGDWIPAYAYYMKVEPADHQNYLNAEAMMQTITRRIVREAETDAAQGDEVAAEQKLRALLANDPENRDVREALANLFPTS
ncbi:hypothetical protein QO008_000386 [Peptoniphilus ivorii]|uniref:hypothetical protein n=1 Tax=Aedoeadaptatus ivorii TaxID=54006 RepID=UPI0027872109|nr:hypothetical protein [Peptoniphilus ivorii]MDQ0507942.1 hypothetical protein [Peptoniphilus ivorii]